VINKCGECNRCCALFAVTELNKRETTLCPFWDKKCTIYSSRPKSCKEFSCAWLQSGSANINLRPDKCGILFEKLSERIFFGTVDPEIKMSEIGVAQIKSFVLQGYSVVLASPKEATNRLFLNEHHKEEEIIFEMGKYIERYGNLWNRFN